MNDTSNPHAPPPSLSFDLHGLDLHPELRLYLARRLEQKFGKFVSRIERVTVRLEESAAHRGPVEKACRVKVALLGLPSVILDYRDLDPRAAVDGALDHAERAVRRALKRRSREPVARGRRQREHERPAEATPAVVR